MSDKPGVRIFEAPNTMRRKARPTGGLTLEEMERGAEKAIQRLKLGHERELDHEIAGLTALAREIADDPDCVADKIGSMLIRAQSVRVLAATFDHPLLSEVADSLCAMLDGHEIAREKMLRLIQLHIDAIRLVVKQKMKDPEAPEWKQVFKMLESAIQKAAAARYGQ